VLRINALGGLSVERDGRTLAGAAAQPRRLAILAMLARADDRGITRDRVVTLLWPDTDEERARRALTQALYALRQDLGDEDAITGVKELRLNPELVSTDLRAFVSARARAALDDAAAAYRGPFLDGFHIPGAEEFDRWAEEERRVLAREFADLIERLASLAEGRGDFTAAVSWWRRLAGLDPLNARIAVSLMRALEAAGDRNGAIQHARLHEALVEQNLDLPPDREVIALASRLRRESRRQSTEAQTAIKEEAVLEEEEEAETPVATVPALPVAGEGGGEETGPSDVMEPVVSSPPVVASQAKADRRWWILAGAMVGVIILTIALKNRAPATAASDQPVVVVGRIMDYTSEAGPGRGSPLGDMLATNLARAPGLRVVSTARMNEMLARTAASSGDTTLGVVMEAARQAGATELIDGATYTVGEGRLRLDIRRVDLASGAVIRAYTVMGADLFALADSASLRIVRHLGTTLPPGSLAEVTTRSAVAYRLYAEGQRAYSTGDRERADSLFVAAMSEDSTFAMANYYHAMLTRDGITALARALELSASASERERLVIRAEWALANSSPTILAFAESLMVRYPAEVEGPLYYGRALMTLGRFNESIPPLQRVVDMDGARLVGRTVVCAACDALQTMLAAYLHADSAAAGVRVARRWVTIQPDSPIAWINLGAALEISGSLSEAADAFAAASRLEPRNTEYWQARVPPLLRSGDFAAAERLTEQHIAGSPYGSAWWTINIRRYTGRLEGAIEEARRALAAARTPQNPSSMMPLLAQALLEGGHHREAAVMFDSSALGRHPLVEPSNIARYRGWMLTHMADALAAAGDTARLEAIADSVRVLGAQTSYGRDQRLFHHVRGLLLRARGDLPGAADEFRSAIWTPTFGFTRSNLELAKALIDLGRPLEAVAALQPAMRGSLEASNLYVTLTDLHEQLGRAWEAAGNADSAVAHYEYVARAWQHGDPPFAQRAAEARAKAVGLRPSRR
jgi:DNA-binding SARP family transcriptional activator/predicted Zn-dependent protease/TolB-like protein